MKSIEKIWKHRIRLHVIIILLIHILATSCSKDDSIKEDVVQSNANNITSLPKVNTNLLKLTLLTAASNNLTAVPDSFNVLTNLALLSLTNNPINTNPQEVCELQIANGGVLTFLTDPGEGCS